MSQGQINPSGDFQHRHPRGDSFFISTSEDLFARAKRGIKHGNRVGIISMLTVFV